MKDLIALRKSTKAKKPSFKRQDSHKKKRINPSWRKPKGLQSKMRLSRKGYNKIVKDGYGSPKAVRGLSKEGLEKIIVANIAELNAIDPKSQGVIISAKVGDKKRLAIINTAKEKNITILNLKDAQDYATKVEKKMADKKAKKEKHVAKKKEKSIKKKEEKLDTKVDKEVSVEEKKKQEKKEKDKILTSKRGSQ